MESSLLTQHISESKVFSIQPFLPSQHSSLIHEWVNQPYAKFWGMTGQSQQAVYEAYQAFVESSHTEVYLGFYGDEPAFLMESYEPSSASLTAHYPVQAGDRGMHILLAPCSTPLPGFSLQAMQTILSFLFSDPSIKRIVVEPDNRNQKIHQLNKRVGFFHEQLITLKDKKAYLAFCNREQYAAACQLQNRYNANENLPHYTPHTQKPNSRLNNFPSQACGSIDRATWQRVNRWLVRKAIAEFCHERLLKPILTSEQNGSQPWQSYEIISDDKASRYRFSAQKMALNHWMIELLSIDRVKDTIHQDIDAIEFILDFRHSLSIPEDKLPTYLEEITSTLCASAYKIHRPHVSASELATADFQSVETGMTEGHPCFVANNGRIGFDAEDYRAYAPEAASPVTLIWLAAHKSRAHFSVSPDLDYDALISQELDISTRIHFEKQLTDKGLNPDDYLWIPVHPWQWYNKLVTVYAPEIAHDYLVCLGYGDDAYLAQQSIRTFFNISQPGKFYVKTALSVLNMGFMRGLSAYYMRSTPAINQWLYELVANDETLQKQGFSVLRECAAIGYDMPTYDKERLGDNPYRKMLAALWRENPTAQLNTGERLMTMASLLHVDENEQALLPALISASGLSTQAWLARYFEAYLTPLLHCFYRHKLVFMPHGENLIMVLDQHIPSRVFMKDIGEEIYLQNSDQSLPEDVQRISIKMPEDMEILALFTDVFDCFFRFLSQVLVQHCNYSEFDFWQDVAQCITNYQQAHPELSDAFDRHDLFAPSFVLSCLNRLQLRNNQQMVDLADPANSLAFEGILDNPIACFKPTASSKKTHSNSTNALEVCE